MNRSRRHLLLMSATVFVAPREYPKWTERQNGVSTSTALRWLSEELFPSPCQRSDALSIHQTTRS